MANCVAILVAKPHSHDGVIEVFLVVNRKRRFALLVLHGVTLLQEFAQLLGGVLAAIFNEPTTDFVR